MTPYLPDIRRNFTTSFESIMRHARDGTGVSAKPHSPSRYSRESNVGVRGYAWSRSGVHVRNESPRAAARGRIIRNCRKCGTRAGPACGASHAVRATRGETVPHRENLILGRRPADRGSSPGPGASRRSSRARLRRSGSRARNPHRARGRSFSFDPSADPSFDPSADPSAAPSLVAPVEPRSTRHRERRASGDTARHRRHARTPRVIG